MDILPIFHEGEHLLLALSGGADSTALALCMRALSREMPLRLSAAHFHHGLRGPAADRDEAFVRALCRELDIPLEVGYGRLAQKGLLGETQARAARYAFLREAMARQAADVIVTAHHADDQAETVLMHILRGAGLHGACGMAARAGDVARPLLSVTRAQIEAYLARTGQPYATDETNALMDNPRNVLRQAALPALEKAYPQARDALLRFSRNCQIAREHIATEARAWLATSLEALPFGWRAMVDGCPRAVLLEALHQRLPHLGQEALLRLEGLCRAEKGRLSLAAWDFEKCGGQLYAVNPRIRPPRESAPLADGAALGAAGLIRLAPARPVPIRSHGFEQILDEEALRGCRLRMVRPSDRIRPLGMRGEKLVSDLMTDRKIPRPMRAWTPALVRDRRVLWLVGVEIDREAAVRPGRQALRVLWKPADPDKETIERSDPS